MTETQTETYDDIGIDIEDVYAAQEAIIWAWLDAVAVEQYRGATDNTLTPRDRAWREAVKDTAGMGSEYIQDWARRRLAGIQT